MSTAVLEPIVDQPVVNQPIISDFALAAPAPAIPEEKLSDPHPLLPVFITGAIAFTLAVTFVGSIVAWLVLRNSGVMAQ